MIPSFDECSLDKVVNRGSTVNGSHQYVDDYLRIRWQTKAVNAVN